ncbi:ABC transporter permease [Microbacterium timonense]|uniref:ABC transporter permease n=1 Tax=Microbacterium timonense TaxID=2086576 RepID=UPI000D0EDD2B|nr:ABC transporter permease [Microbacterium timonense]
MTVARETEVSAAAKPRRAPDDRSRTSIRWYSFRNISAIYLFIVIFIVFSLWVPRTFLDVNTWRSMLDTESLTAIVAIGLTISLAAGVFDLAIGMQVGLAGIVVAQLLSAFSLPIPIAITITIVVSALVGLVSGLLVVGLRIDSFIATLALASVLTAAVQWVSGGQQILNLSAEFQALGTSDILGITLPVWVMAIVGVLGWYVLDRTPAGRHIYATGGNPSAARLAGVSVGRVTIISLVVGGVIASFAGILFSSRIGVGDPTIGPAFLLPAFAAATLGSTQFRAGRYNILGTLVSVFVLAAGSKGLQLAGAPTWIPDLFNGLAIILAVGLAKWEGRSLRAMAVRRRLADSHG